jgi:cyclohexanone monooxygenase
MRRAVRDRRLRRILTPRYVIGCKRVLVSNDFYPALAQPDVEVIPEAVAEVREHSVVGVGGTEREVDTVIYATGFHVTDLPVAERVRGRDGRTLADVWQGSPRAYLGTAISGFPNAFMLFGPNVGSASAFVMLDAQLRYVTAALRALRGEGLGSIDVRPEVQDAFKAWADRRLEGTTWLAGGCSSYYIDAAGRNAAAWPGTMASLRRRLSRFELSDYACEPVREPVAPAGRAG